MNSDQTTTLSPSALRRSIPAQATTISAVETAGWSDVRQAASAQITPTSRWPISRFDADLKAIQDQLIDGERILEIRTLHQSTFGRATGAIAVTTRRLLVVDLSRSQHPLAETVLFSEVKHAACRRNPLSGMTLTVRTQHGRQYRGLESKDRASANRFVASLQAQIDNPSACQLRTVPLGSVAAQPPTMPARVQRLLERLQPVLGAMLAMAALLFLTGVVGHGVSEGVFACFAFTRAMRKLTGLLATRSRSASHRRILGPSLSGIAVRPTIGE